MALVAVIDAAWSTHFGHAAELREGIHLRVLAREDSLTEFKKGMGATYQGLSGRILDNAVTALLEAPVVDGRLDLESLRSRIPSATWAYTVTDDGLGDDFARMGHALRRRLAGQGWRLPALWGRCGVYLSYGHSLALQRWRMTVGVTFPSGKLADDGRAGVEAAIADRSSDGYRVAVPFGGLGDGLPTRVGMYSRLTGRDREGHRCFLRFRPSCAG